MGRKTIAPYRLLCIVIAAGMVFSLVACGLGNGDIQDIVDQEQYAADETREDAGERRDAIGDSRNATQEAESKLAEIEERLFIDAVTSSSLNFHMSMRNPGDFGIEDIEPTWGRRSTQESFEEGLAETQLLLEELLEIDLDALVEIDDRVLLQNLVQVVDLSLRMGDFFYYSQPFHIMSGLFAQAPLVMAEFQFRRQEDISTYLALMRLFDEHIAGEISYEQTRAELGLFMPDFVLDKVIETSEGFLEGREGEHFLVATFDQRLDALEWLDDEQREQYKQENKRILEEYFFPAYDRIIEELSLLRGMGGTELSERQREYFLLLLEHNTSSNFTPEYIIELLDNALRRTFVDIIFAMRDPEIEEEFSNFALSRGDIHENMEYLRSLAPTIFPELPPHDLSLEVLPDSLEFINSLAFYVVQPVDDYYHNIIRINPEAAENRPGMLLVLAHEGYGGHLLDSVYTRYSGMSKLRLLLNNTSWSEGFANYASAQLLRATGFDSALIEFAISMDAFDFYLGARMEMGVFYEGWTQEDLGNYMQRLFLGMEFEDEEIQEIHELTFASQFIFVRYGVGLAFFENLREEVQTKQGDDFDLLEFHTLILDIGPSPLNIFADTLRDVLSPGGISIEPERVSAA
ncbi:MAG: DUF885 domain-containing protein [Oscillospiraceae bacterium]|nr:DUF885 domain-containing protein [Oscillospiraceae bacterium]